MSDERLREAERKWKETGSVDDEARYLGEIGRTAPAEAFAAMSDVQGNLVALEAVLHDLDSLGRFPLVFLGDAIGRGPHPVECVDILRERSTVYGLGRWEGATLGTEALGFGAAATATLDWLREKLRPKLFSPRSRSRWRWLQSRSVTASFEAAWLRHHGIPGDELCTVFFDDVARSGGPTRDNVLEGAPASARVVLVGANLEAWWASSASGGQAMRAVDSRNHCEVGQGERVVVSPGSVGAPRDGDPRASYCLILANRVIWRRVSYDVERVAAEIVKVPGVPASWGARILSGT